jgi:hypothetical protein
MTIEYTSFPVEGDPRIGRWVRVVFFGMPEETERYLGRVYDWRELDTGVPGERAFLWHARVYDMAHPERWAGNAGLSGCELTDHDPTAQELLRILEIEVSR